MKIKLLILFSVLGLIDAVYLSYHFFANTQMVCVALRGCDYVTTSEYSTLLGIPIALLGAIYYFIIFIFSINLLFHHKITFKKKLLLSNQFILLIGTLAYIYLIYIQADILNAYCIYCLFSAMCTFFMFIINSFTLKEYLTS